ncbi:hypothetical protein Q8A64_15265 [Oxalobacteraceae bacterium R-40]|uniref:Uncharacterized protein n=1 Tax=Keguizhuia sedimenti TaxID=3064264 RepID=A0ABU1BS44_9BURK|nr:hypothetical protein [Oxalobacteraceae bacterium R-40]
MEMHASPEQPRTADAKTELVEMTYQASVSRNTRAGSFSYFYQDGTQDPLMGEEPILVRPFTSASA